jgi:lipoprotein-anchoring transpeptidase ErfK/SrfK
MKVRSLPLLAIFAVLFSSVQSIFAQNASLPEGLTIAKAEPAGEREIATRLQIFLDQKGFGPGIIDGRSGEFTLKALGRYQLANGLPVTKNLADAVRLPLDEIFPIYTTYTIQEDDLKRVGNVPGKPSEQAKVKKLPYSSFAEFLQERYHASIPFLQKLNPTLDMEKLAVGDEVRVPNVPPFKIEAVRALGKLPVVLEFKNRRIHVDTKERILDLYENEKLVATFPITPGAAHLPAPVGTWRILGIATMPYFRHDEGVLNHGIRTSNFFNIPPGPNNPVGVVWIGLNKPGIGIHGTNNPETIGRAGSHGCIRVANWDVIRLANMITEGMTVTIANGPTLEPAVDTGSTAAPATAPKRKISKLSSN